MLWGTECCECCGEQCCECYGGQSVVSAVGDMKSV